jgi:RNA polymerase sigma factor (sigma-70 family)
VSATVDDQSGDLLARWRQGDQQAAAEMFRRYADRLIALARSRLSPELAQRFDPEDVVQSVYRSFFAGAREGCYELQRGGDLWRLLVAITLNKIHTQVRHHSTGKRAVQCERSLGSEESLFGLEVQLLAHDPSPPEAAALTDEVDQIMRRLDPVKRRIFELRLQSYDLEEIAAQVGCSERTVRYVLAEIKQHLQRSTADRSAS